MGIEDLRRRRDERRAKGVPPGVYPQHAGKAKVVKPAAAKAGPQLIPLGVSLARAKRCGHLDPKELSRSCGGTTHRCNLHGDVVSRPGRCTQAKRSCLDCDDHTALARPHGA